MVESTVKTALARQRVFVCLVGHATVIIPVAFLCMSTVYFNYFHRRLSTRLLSHYRYNSRSQGIAYLRR